MTSERRRRIGDAGVTVIARDGIRKLTHRSVDEQSGLPVGSTSYYARTRRQLLALIVDRLAEYTTEDLAGLRLPTVLDAQGGAEVVQVFLHLLASRDDAQAARFGLLFELRHDDELRRALTVGAPVRVPLLLAAESLLKALGITNATSAAPDLVAVVDAVLMYSTSRAAPVDAGAVIRTYLAGLLADDAR
ncbi:TetR family transcriptional regulator [Rathayibacter rathayi]|uniref:TetR family transcriptional regulator n=1 Tax=Rathayibacter rathayi TaxID=33887 RepID=A0ABD6W7J0_RATRA|nr:TetR/AcrR family transcriptional regulator [Rathayibacter rathayi]AZZ48228.1 TetR family transcriptional regulator [Rathayibacter rathayi]MWV75512.1 TetR family transcriptional regulator [Rathayibacter rathayi NCPPB 2980 = VKM Ac-1601]PPF13019.1 TetR family transcriptional regulator [Rathayibacter rathayi]PPF22912.1 TetR family transcriptional regulator [Rathayibacter rathayi]PPG70366.1 TetR family transcriptional regulator [Rathayibacter rathayi]